MGLIDFRGVIGVRQSAIFAAMAVGLGCAAASFGQDGALLSAGPFGREGTVKVRVPTEVGAAGTGRLVADYGSFSVFEADARAIPAGLGMEVLEQENLILLNSGWLDTTQAAVKRLRVPRAAFQGRALHMVQFAGPIKREWRD